MTGGRLRSALAVGTINAAVLLAGIVVIELIFGHWFAARPGLALLRVPRNLELAFDDSRIVEKGGVKRYRRDRYGLRGQYDDPSRIDILAIGGSTTNELHVGEGETWTDVLAARFRADRGAFSVVNAGVEGHSTVGHIRSFELWFPNIPGLRARYVLVYVGINDTLVHDEQRGLYDELDTRPSLLRRILRHIQDRSVLFDLYRIVAGWQRAWSANVVHGNLIWEGVNWEEHALPGPLADAVSLKRRDEYGVRLALLIARIRKFDATPIIVTQQRAGYRRSEGRLLLAKGRGFESSIATYQLQTAFNARGGICIDLGSELVFAEGDFYDLVHTTAQGSRRIANYLYGALKDLIP
jgi:lysophospholipase L1-like esterase